VKSSCRTHTGQFSICARSEPRLPTAQEGHDRKRNSCAFVRTIAAIIFLIPLIGCGGLSDSPASHLVARSQNVANGQIQVDAGKLAYYKVEVTPDMQDPVINGSFSASGGGGNDIVTVIADEINYINWANGHDSQVLWSTNGQQTVGKFSVNLKPGVYYLGISNKFSAISDKQVALKVELDYKQQAQGK
jgi:hypothetical protein